MYRIVFRRRTEKQLRKIPARDRERILEAISSLGLDPFQGKKLEGDFDGFFAIRIWPYRVIYAIDRKIVTVTIVRVGHRQGVYK